jgi:muramoyltetrapeptide carboxypeptidase
MIASLARAPALRPGDRIAVLSVSSPPDQLRLAAGLDALRVSGLEPVVYPSARDSGTLRHYLAGEDAMRVGDLTSALRDPGIAGVVFACGGSGAARTLASFDWDALEGVTPKVLAGYSDVTAILEAAARRLGWASLHSTMVAGFDTYQFASLLRALMHPERATSLCFAGARTVVPGVAAGITCGGNLTVLTASLGTDTSWPAHGGIWLVEDDSEDDYRIDRMLTQLRRHRGHPGDPRRAVGLAGRSHDQLGRHRPRRAEPDVPDRRGRRTGRVRRRAATCSTRPWCRAPDGGFDVSDVHTTTGGAMKYLLLIYNNPATYEAMPEDERNALFADVDRIMDQLKNSGEFVGGQALADPSQSKTVRVRDGVPAVTDGPYVEAKEQMGGYLIVDCETAERAVEIAASWPDAKYFAMEVRPIMDTVGADV